MAAATYTSPRLSDNRVLVFSTGTTLGGAAKSVLGQSDFTTTTANTGALPLASANSLSSPADVKSGPEWQRCSWRMPATTACLSSAEREIGQPRVGAKRFRIERSQPDQALQLALSVPHGNRLLIGAVCALCLRHREPPRPGVEGFGAFSKRRSGGPGGWAAESADRSGERGYARIREPFENVAFRAAGDCGESV